MTLEDILNAVDGHIREAQNLLDKLDVQQGPNSDESNEDNIDKARTALNAAHGALGDIVP